VDVNQLYTFQNPTANGSTVGAQAQLANLTGFFERYPTQRSYAWNVSLEHELPWQTGVRASYVGNLSRHMSRNVRVNACPPGPTECLSRAATAADARAWPFFNTNLGRVADDGAADYHALELEIQRRLSGGLLFNANYSLASFQGYQFDASDPVTRPLWRYDWGPMGMPRHIGHLNFVYELPVGRDRRLGRTWSGPLNAVLGGWMLSGSGSWQSGNYLTITTGTSETPTGATANTVSRADLTGTPALADDRSRAEQVRQWFNTSAFALPAFVDPTATRPTRQFGSSPIGAVVGPAFWSFDLVLQKLFTVGPMRLQVRAELYNPFNAVMLGDPVTSVSNPTFGQILTSNVNYTPRTLQIGTRIDW
jgi:hypothetical protein